LIQGCVGNEGNQIADKEAKEAASRPVNSLLLTIKVELNTQKEKTTTLIEGHHE
jgi:hypothetical protein